MHVDDVVARQDLLIASNADGLVYVWGFDSSAERRRQTNKALRKTLRTTGSQLLDEMANEDGVKGGMGAHQDELTPPARVNMRPSRYCTAVVFHPSTSKSKFRPLHFPIFLFTAQYNFSLTELVSSHGVQATTCQKRHRAQQSAQNSEQQDFRLHWKEDGQRARSDRTAFVALYSQRNNQRE